MKILKSVTSIAAIALGGLGVVMAVTNPSKPEYEEYAVQQLTEYVKQEVCNDAPKIFGILLQRSNCNGLIDSSHPAIKKIIAVNTERKNFILFSIYTTDLSVSSSIPSYHFETVAGLQNFYIYTAEKR